MVISTCIALYPYDEAADVLDYVMHFVLVPSLVVKRRVRRV